jgi:hypothetical protein
MKEKDQHGWQDRWRAQWLEAKLERLWLVAEASQQMRQLAHALAEIEAQDALIALYAALAGEDDVQPP